MGINLGFSHILIVNITKASLFLHHQGHLSLSLFYLHFHLHLRLHLHLVLLIEPAFTNFAIAINAVFIKFHHLHLHIIHHHHLLLRLLIIIIVNNTTVTTIVTIVITISFVFLATELTTVKATLTFQPYPYQVLHRLHHLLHLHLNIITTITCAFKNFAFHLIQVSSFHCSCVTVTSIGLIATVILFITDESYSFGFHVQACSFNRKSFLYFYLLQ
jgi:hypothetical protein